MKPVLWLGLLAILLPLMVSAEDQCIRVLNGSTGIVMPGLNCTFNSTEGTALMNYTGGLYCIDISNYTINVTHVYQATCTNGTYNETIWDTFTRYVTEVFDEDMIAIILGLIAISVFFFALGIIAKGLGLKIFCYGISIVQVLLMSYFLLLNELNESLIPLLRVNFFTMFIIGGGTALVVLLLYAVHTVNTDNEGDEGEEKWVGGTKWGK